MVDFSKYKVVFCDSIQALEWAYKNGLPKSTVVKTSAPAILLKNNKNIYNIESRWTKSDLDTYQNSISELNKTVYKEVLKIKNVERELALVVSQSVFQFQKILYKAACLEKKDFTDHRLFIFINGETGSAKNMMNSPWKELLSCNKLFSSVEYTLKNDKWEVLNTKGVSYWKRFKVAGYETAVYRIVVKLMSVFPDIFFKKEILMPNENELNIETAYSLAMRGVRITNIKLKSDSTINPRCQIIDVNIESIYQKVLPVLRKIAEKWLDPIAVDVVLLLFRNFLEGHIEEFKFLIHGWEEVISGGNHTKKAVLINSPANTNGNALSYVCKRKNIPLISSQHGVTVEISKNHKLLQNWLDNSVADIMLSYNESIIEIEKSSFFNKSKHYNVGMPLRLIRMKNEKTIKNIVTPIIYISTNLYYMGFSISKKNDFEKAKSEIDIVVEVLGRLPYKVKYKTYPEDSRRYADIDPVIDYVKKESNIELFSKKVDMRYLFSYHRVVVTTCATSTLGWAIMSKKPVVFINQKNNNPLTKDSYLSMKKSIFIFNDDDNDFLKNLRSFLSQPIEEIEKLWAEKEFFRKIMIKKYFSSHENGGAGKRSAQVILSECL